jgi:tartrate dehydratase alpha subunit/fumarate hydratase class I-like protein
MEVGGLVGVTVGGSAVAAAANVKREATRQIKERAKDKKRKDAYAKKYKKPNR